MPWDWLKEDAFRLSDYARQEVGDILPLGVSDFDLLQQEDGNRKLLEAIYEALLGWKVQYALEPPAASVRFQKIRTQEEILKPNGKGTCLDLAVLFCSVCLKYNLLPVLIKLEGHALVAVSLNNTMHDWRHRREKLLFDGVLVQGEQQARKLIELVEQRAYLAVDCTGFARSQTLGNIGDTPECVGRRADGTLAFDAAVTAGEQQFALKLKRPFCYALDIGTAHYFYELRPYKQAELKDERQFLTIADKQGAPKNFDPLPYLLDRSAQEKALRDAVLFKRAIKPQRPLVCVVHGDEFECHEHFVKRMTDKSLPEILKFWHPEEVEQTPVLQRRVKLSLAKVDSQMWEEVFWGDLAEGITGDRSSPREAIVNMISGQRLAVLLDVTLRSEDLSQVTLDKLDLFFEFWDRWPNLPEKLLLFVCLSFKYERRFEGSRKMFFWKRSGLNDHLRQYVERLNFTPYPNLHGVNLPELRAIPRADAEDVINHDLVKESYNLTDVDVVSVYNSSLCTPEGCIPMMLLLDRFSQKRI